MTTQTLPAADLAALEAEAEAILTAGRPCAGNITTRWLVTFWKKTTEKCHRRAAVAALLQSTCCGHRWVYLCDPCAAYPKPYCLEHGFRVTLITTVHLGADR